MPSLISAVRLAAALRRHANQLTHTVDIEADEGIAREDALYRRRVPGTAPNRRATRPASSASDRWFRRRRTVASCAISPAINAARGSSIIVPTRYSIVCPRSANTCAATRSTNSRRIASSRRVATSGIMISGTGASPESARHVAGRLEYGARLHFVDFGIGDAQPAAAMAQHRVEFVQFRRTAFQMIDPQPRRIGQCRQTPHRHAAEIRAAADRADGSCRAGPTITSKIARKSDALFGQQFGQRRAPPGLVFGQDHFAHRADPDPHRRTCVRCGTGRCPPPRTGAPCGNRPAFRHWSAPASGDGGRPIP